MDHQITKLQNAVSLDDIARDYGRMVSSICRRMIFDEDIAKDAAQQVWVEIVRSFPSFRGDSKVSTWIYTITRRVALEHAKNERIINARFLRLYSLQEEFDPPDNTDPDKTLWVKEMCDKCLTGMLHCFDNETRLAYILREIAELSYEEIAEILKKDETAVRQMVSRSKRKLRSFMLDRCMLYNPDSADCRCRMKKWVKKVNLAREYDKVRETVRRVSFYKQSEIILPRRDYWELLL